MSDENRGAPAAGRDNRLLVTLATLGVFFAGVCYWGSKLNLL
jgi:hypothetical protein